MKKKSASRSAFFNLRVLIGLFVVLAGVFLALVSLGTFSAIAASSAKAKPKHKIINIPGLPPGFDCATIHANGIDRMENLRAGAIMIACGELEGGSASPANTLVGLAQKLLPVPLAYGAADVDLVTGTETPPHIIQSETFSTANPDNPDEICVAFNDSRGAAANNFSGVSCSTDGGLTFTRVTNGSGQSPFATTFGDPVILYNKPTQTWFTVWLDGNGSCTLGGYKSSTPEDPNSWTHFCVHNNGGDDRESGWADNNPSSPFFGRMYISWNDFNIGAGALVESFSSDNGNTWSSAVTVINSGTFIRNTQITGDMSGNGTLYIAGMDEGGGGFPHNDTNKIFKSTDGGASWSNTYTGTPFPGPGVCSSGYFAGIFSTNGCYWRHEGWGEPAAFNNIVHLVYAQHGTGSDPGDVYYIRSSDGGVTFSAPFKLNTDSTTRPQWQPNLSVSPTGTVFATWYDARESTDSDCQYGVPASPCYRMWSRKSNDNGVSWLSDDTFSDVVSPLPAQSDPNIVGSYVGDYDYGAALLTKHVTSWADGRVAIGGASQQDTFTDRELVGFAVTTSDPACNSVISTQPTDFVIDLSDAVNTGTVQATDFTVNGTPANSVTFQNGDTQITFHFNSSPVSTPGVQTMNIPANAFTRVSDGMGNFEFNCSFCYVITPLQVTTTNPPVGGTFAPPAPGDYQYDVNFNQAVDPASVGTSDLTLTGNAGGSVTSVQVINGNQTAEFTVHFAFGGSVTASIGAGAITAEGCNGNAAFTGNYNVSGCPPSQYVITDGTDTIVPGTTDTGNHTDDGDTFVALPFNFQLYDQTYNGVNVSSNGRLDFVTVNEPGGYITSCLPAPPNIGPYDFTIFPVWQDLRTDFGLSGCSSFPGGNCGVFTSVSGTAPNRIFNIEWRAVYFANNATTANFEARLYENDPNLKFEVIVGSVQAGGDHNYVSGVQGDSGAGFFTQDFCDANPPAAASHTYEIPPCASPSPTPTATASPTATATATPTATPTATATATATATPRPTPTPRSLPTPRPRPTPHPRA
jgi:hypothetical protein